MGITNFFTSLFGFLSNSEVKKRVAELFDKPSEYKDYYLSNEVKIYAKGLDAVTLAKKIEKDSGKRASTVSIYQALDSLRNSDKIFVASYVEGTGIPIYKKIQYHV